MPPVAQQVAEAVAAAADFNDTRVASGDCSSSSNRDVARSRMRRVASAPAFKHASCFSEVSPTAAVAAAAAAAASSSTTATATLTRKQQQQQQHPSLLRSQQPCSSCSGGRCNCLEVYVVSRSFTEFAGPVMRRLHPDARQHLVDMGICHYMTVFKTPDGQLVQFDFGPLGGDVQKAHGPLATFLRRARAAAQQQQLQDAAAATAAAAAAAAAASSASDSSGDGGGEQLPGSGSSSSSHGPSSGSGSSRGMVHSPSAPSLPMASLDLAAGYGGGAGGEAAIAAMVQEEMMNRPKRGVAGEIRERQLHVLPPACMYMGRTSLTLDDIRQYNAAQCKQTYTLHENDCRHYVNSLVQYTTGVERSTQHLKRHYFHSRNADKWLWYGWFMSAAQLVTDVGNWSHVQAGAAVTLLAVTGRSTLASLKTLATPMLPAIKGLPALLPSAGFAAAAAGGAAPAAAGGAAAAASSSAAAAAAAGAGNGGAVMASLATTLKLPAAMLLKRPLAAGAAAGSAGAAAAVMRDTTGTAAAASGSSSSSSSNAGNGRSPSRTWGAVGRPLQVVGDGMTHGLRAAVLGIRRYALGNTRALQQLQHQPLVVPELAFAGAGVVPAATAAVAPVAPVAAGGARRGFWAGSSRSGEQQQQQARKWFFGFKARGADSSGQMQLVRQPVGGSSMLAAPAAAVAVTAAGGGVGAAWQQQQHEGSIEQQQQPARRRPLAQLGHNVGRHVLWLGSAAARASGQLAMFAFGGSRAAQAFAAAPAPLVVGGSPPAMDGTSRGAVMLMHSASSHQLQHLQLQQQQQQSLPTSAFGPHRSLSMPSLLAADAADAAPSAVGAPAAAATATAAAGPVHVCGGPIPCSTGTGSGFSTSSGGVGGGVGDGTDMTFMWSDSAGSSSITCSSIGGGGKSSGGGVGRQVLNLPAPRLSWSKRASQAMILRQ